jgi:hypothetical protein
MEGERGRGNGGWREREDVTCNVYEFLELEQIELVKMATKGDA